MLYSEALERDPLRLEREVSVPDVVRRAVLENLQSFVVHRGENSGLAVAEEDVESTRDVE